MPLPPDIKALEWLQGQGGISSLPKIYFSARAPRGDGEEYAKDSDEGTQSKDIDACGFRAVAGVGGAVLFHDSKPFSKSHWTSIQRCIILPALQRWLSGFFDHLDNLLAQFHSHTLLLAFVLEVDPTLSSHSLVSLRCFIMSTQCRIHL